ncbi:hypothetical protein ACEZCY_35750 [Streptacidiphilus sp. N1-12]|uniref:Uncharacterized protein n=1 Tax=Streptacidiphilus alkalitolerans TaxID=3342712 RepID=A0ABV6WR64_9ACTN
MTAPTPHTEAEDRTPAAALVRGDQALPAHTQAGSEAAVPARLQGPPAMGQDLVRTITETAQVVRYLDAVGTPAADITVTAVTAPVCTGDTVADALQAAADFARAAPRLQVNACSLARVPGHVDGLWQWAVTLYVAAADPRTGEYNGEVHHGEPVSQPGY